MNVKQALHYMHVHDMDGNNMSDHQLCIFLHDIRNTPKNEFYNLSVEEQLSVMKDSGNPEMQDYDTLEFFETINKEKDAKYKAIYETKLKEKVHEWLDDTEGMDDTIMDQKEEIITLKHQLRSYKANLKGMCKRYHALKDSIKHG